MSQKQPTPALIDTSRAPVPGTTNTAASSPAGKTTQEASQVGNHSVVPELPPSYGKDRLVILVRDPRWLFAYWELTASSWERARSAYAAPAWEQGWTLLRLLTADLPSPAVANQTKHTGSTGHQLVWQAEVGMADNWYIELPAGLASYTSLYAELGRSLPGGEFVPLLQSNIAFLPPQDVSPIQDEYWLTIEEVWQHFMGLPPGTSSEAFIRALRARFAREAFSPGISAPLLMSPGISPGFSPGAWQGWPGAARQFWLTVSTDLILYGATEPGATVTVGDQPVTVAADGSFRLQFHLVDGELVLPVTARQPQTGLTCETIIRIRRETTT
ncbi:MAG: DUF4912 domain-containing protein [Limnochordales bacterium]|nr:DUF4912 domain-containing protein [Limnochordales bacterium]